MHASGQKQDLRGAPSRGVKAVSLRTRAYVATRGWGWRRGEEAEAEEEVVVVVEEVVFTRDNRGGSAQHATRATPLRSSHGPMRA